MPVPPPAVMQPALSITRSNSTTGGATDQASRRVSLGLRTHSSGDSSTSSTNVPKETYNWRGQRYEVDEDTLPE
ncbi:hypothetical protein Slin15195_G105470 [Septoria linicola]|uniref:Uncharacterized protein n=1 Tax=Septoria linicola TaxID=215465 RepID=A0A9Q9EQ69_9PEZI|nr:hypothetical protein Slin15195_G105470 [Septoria linicola]